MRRILSTGWLLLALTSAAWWLAACVDDDDSGDTVIDAEIIPPTDTSSSLDVPFPEAGEFADADEQYASE